MLALGFRSHTDIPALKELEEWFDTQKEMRATAKLDPYFERISRLASRRLKREIERRGTLGEFALEPDLSLKRIAAEECGSDLFRSDGPDAAALSYRVEPPQRQAITASLKPTRRAWISTRSSRCWPAFRVAKVSLTLALLDISFGKIYKVKTL